MGFSRQEYWSGLSFPSPGDLHYPGIELGSPALQVPSLPSDIAGKPLPGSNLMFSAATWDQFHFLIFVGLTDSHGSHFSFSYFSSVLFLSPWLFSCPSIHTHSRYCNQTISIFTWIKKCCSEKGHRAWWRKPASCLPGWSRGPPVPLHSKWKPPRHVSFRPILSSISVSFGQLFSVSNLLSCGNGGGKLTHFLYLPWFMWPNADLYYTPDTVYCYLILTTILWGRDCLCSMDEKT